MTRTHFSKAFSSADWSSAGPGLRCPPEEMRSKMTWNDVIFSTKVQTLHDGRSILTTAAMTQNELAATITEIISDEVLIGHIGRYFVKADEEVVAGLSAASPELSELLFSIIWPQLQASARKHCTYGNLFVSEILQELSRTPAVMALRLAGPLGRIRQG